jgi:hypothetical protein
VGALLLLLLPLLLLMPVPLEAGVTTADNLL